MSNFVADIISKSSVLKVGIVISVEGRTIKVLVDREKNTSHLFYKGELVKSIVVGSYVKITKGFEELVGKIEGEYIEEDNFQSKKNYKTDLAKIRRILVISLLGYFNVSTFERGIKELPLIDNECFLLDEKEFSRVHHFIKEDDTPIHIGQLAQERGMSVDLGVNGLFASHVGIFGNTGSGKSYTLASLYHTLFQQYKDMTGFKKNAAFFLIDFNGEYINLEDKNNDNVITDASYKSTYNLSTKKTGNKQFPINKDFLTDVSIWKIILEATEKTQTPFISRAIFNDYLDNQIGNKELFNEYIIDLVNRILESNNYLYIELPSKLLSDINQIINANLSTLINKFRQHLNYHGKENNKFYLRIDGSSIYFDKAEFKSTISAWFKDVDLYDPQLSNIKKIWLKFICQYYHEIISGYSNQEHLAPLIKRMETRIPELEKVICVTKEGKKNNQAINFTIISLKDVNTHMKKILPLILCKQLYEEKKANSNKCSFLNIIIDEAHNILSEDSQRESEQWKDYRLETFEEIIKEGRKFGVFLTIASQRPSDISPTIISQLHNYFLHRLINNNDIKAIERTVSYLDKVSFESLPILPTGTCILAGLVAQVPVVVEIKKIDAKYKPFNQTIVPTKYWN
ncbi:MAG TPA: ATP-binding protein [Legionella sp.]|nr:ATP-binding protein [Legionella sp.]